MRDFLRNFVRSTALKFPPIARIFHERNLLAAENRRLRREYEHPSHSLSSENVNSVTMSTLPTKLNLGCGSDHRDGYFNVDLDATSNPDLVADAKKLTNLPTAYFEEILAIDVLEHLHRDDTEVALKEWARLLKPQGRLKLRVPSILDLASLLENTRPEDINRQKELVQNLYGTQSHTGDYHYTGFTKPLLTAYLREAGFQDKKWTLKDGWMFEVDAIKIDHAL